ncbi:phage head closure protein [Kurthia gibsonii]|uniref:phage head closure protein n=1 Tax=Kurthia gibsonii TaxID=33946 RepID=UPI003AFB4E92
MITIKNHLISLISIGTTKDDLMQDIETEILKEVFAEKRSISQQEFFNAGQTDIKPTKCFVIYAHEYNDERFLIYENKKYSIYRTYEKDEDIELYCEVRTSGN